MKLDEFESQIEALSARGTAEAAAELRDLSAQIRRIAWSYGAKDRALAMAQRADDRATELGNLQGSLPRFPAVYSAGNCVGREVQ